MISQKNSAVACIGRIGRSVLFASFCPIILVVPEIIVNPKQEAVYKPIDNV
jgi:hypothetical protein